MTELSDHWQLASRRWQHVVPPHCPTAEDLAFSVGAVANWSALNGAPRVVILGVTPQLYYAEWPSNSDIIAVDNNPSMIRNVWPGPAEAATLADWRTMALPDGSRDIAITDGGFSMLPFPDDLLTVLANLHRIIVAGGLVLARLYVPTVEPESLESVLADLYAGKIGNLALLKTRLWNAHFLRPDIGVKVADIWDNFNKYEPDLPALAARIGWEEGHMCALNSYKNSGNVYSFFRIDDLTRLLGNSNLGFCLEAVHTPGYEQGELCPSILLRRI